MPLARVDALTPDASDRRYYRVTPEHDAEPLIIARHGAPFAPGSLPFSNVEALLAAVPVPIPRIRHEMADLGILVLDDLGDVTLQEQVGRAPDTIGRLYEQAVDYIALMQRRGADLADGRFLPYGLAFDVEKLMWEMDFFIQHFLEQFRQLNLGVGARDALRHQLLEITETLAAERRVLCHRDYHSRNLMVHNGRLFVIDFQDARMGPDTYDLVSLLRDSYVDLPDTLVTALITRFRTAALVPDDAPSFRRRFDLMSVQRNLKALGTFGYQAVARANPLFAQYVPRTLSHIRRTLGSDERFGNLRDMLSHLLPELA